jgi:branched-subunit amino acid ABC-type transport system permease component
MVEAVIAQFLNGLSQAMLLIMIAAGLSIIFGLMDVLNFAHGSFYMLGAYIGLTTVTVTGQFWFALVVAFVVVAAVGGLLEFVALRPLYDRDPVYHLLITFGFLLIMDHSVQVIWGPDPQNISPPALFDGSIQVLNVTYPLYRIFIFVAGLIFTVGLYLLLRRSDMGLIVRAGTHNKETVRAFGVNLPRVFTFTFAFGVGIAAVSGVMAAPIVGLNPAMGTAVIIDAFIVVIIGGLGSFRGAVVAALLIAEIRALGVLVFPRFTVILVFLALIVVLTVRPTGLFDTGQGGGH